MKVFLILSLLANIYLLFRLLSERSLAWQLVDEARRTDQRAARLLLAKLPAEHGSFDVLRMRSDKSQTEQRAPARSPRHG